eukprot:Phypoly_transcript_09314.p1 GENE.Phypoly_transcript_09314~~Phypoly_transcript_09314.p1  ORF type:complete len:428 (+),score=42.58 Phypoly_transcript_09314:61-1344(+)
MSKHKERAFVVGVGMTKFTKPMSGNKDYPEMGKEAITNALKDAQIPYKLIEAAVAGYCYGEPTCGQRVVYQSGLTGIPIVNVNNNCSTGSSALWIARNFVLGGIYSCVLAVGFEKMERNLSQRYTDAGYTSPVERHFEQVYEWGTTKNQIGQLNEMTGTVIKMFGEAAMEHQRLYNSNDSHLATISYKNHRHSIHNPNAMIQREFPFDAVADKTKAIWGPITSLQACPTADGAAAAIVCSEAFVKKYGLYEHAIEIVSQAVVTDLPSSFEDSGHKYMNLCGYEMAKEGAARVYKESGFTPADVDVVEVHDCFSCNELLMYEALGLCKKGEAGKFIETGKWMKNKQGGELFVYDNKVVVNPSGGLESKGHPIGATGLGQCAELCWQLRNECGKRQVDGAKVALQHNFGLGSAAVITLYKKYVPLSAKL